MDEWLTTKDAEGQELGILHDIWLTGPAGQTDKKSTQFTITSGQTVVSVGWVDSVTGNMQKQDIIISCLLSIHNLHIINPNKVEYIIKLWV